ncbi:hypothetical protein AUJ65_04485 [Candidatus Micrarchaeota archaeon CG1_02_51_15]|nr:MAG: hypothetical protein AUJ65_04485 [Candidatus Micrarchaeota archaeon CG1_02_51_15]
MCNKLAVKTIWQKIAALLKPQLWELNKPPKPLKAIANGEDGRLPSRPAKRDFLSKIGFPLRQFITKGVRTRKQ